MADDVPDLRGGKMAWLPLAMFLITIVGGLWGFAWQAAQYPRREEFNSLRDVVARLDKTSAVMEAHQEATTNSVRDVKTQGDRIETKVDELTKRRR